MLILCYFICLCIWVYLGCLLVVEFVLADLGRCVVLISEAYGLMGCFF